MLCENENRVNGVIETHAVIFYLKCIENSHNTLLRVFNDLNARETPISEIVCFNCITSALISNFVCPDNLML